jgi:hypothetical protein
MLILADVAKAIPEEDLEYSHGHQRLLQLEPFDWTVHSSGQVECYQVQIDMCRALDQNL